MLTKFSKWILYGASYFPLYLILALRVLFTEQDGVTSLKQRALYNWTQHSPLMIVLLMLFIISGFIIHKIQSFRANERVYSKLIKNVTGEMASFFIPFILSFLAISMDWYGWMISAFIFFLCGFIVIQADWLHLCPVFSFMGYILYKDEKDKYILTRLKREQFNQVVLEDFTGVEVRALTPNLYIAMRNKF